MSCICIDEHPYVSHWSQVPWDFKRWPNFHPSEFASPDNGQIYFFPLFFDKLQAARTALGKPLVINSGHRSFRHNISVGGRPDSQHKKMAVDVSLIGHNRFDVLLALRAVGFKGFGYYVNFIHVDLGDRRFWYGSDDARRSWGR